MLKIGIKKGRLTLKDKIMEKTEIKEEILKALGEASVLFMSKEERGVDIIMPTEELVRIADELAEKIGGIK